MTHGVKLEVTTTYRFRILTATAVLLLAGLLSGHDLEARVRATSARDTQDSPPPARGNRANRVDPFDPSAPVSTGELVNMLDTYAIVRAQAELTLNDTQYPQFVTRLKRLQELRRRNQRERNQILQDLRRLTGPLAKAFIGAAILSMLFPLLLYALEGTVRWRNRILAGIISAAEPIPNSLA